MRALEEWSFEEAVEAHAVLDALDSVEERMQKDAAQEAEDKRQNEPRRKGRRSSQ